MKIAFAGSRGIPALYGGFETAVEEIGARLVERGHEVTVYCRAGYDEDAGRDYRGMRRVSVPYVHRRAVETLTHTACALLHASIHRPDVMILMNPANGPLLILSRLTRIPTAINVDGLDWERSKWPPLGQRVIYFGAWCCTKLAPAIIADSHGIQQFYRQQWGCDTYYASYGAEPGDDFSRMPLKELGLETRNYLLVVARLEPENNTDLILKAYGQAELDLPLVVVGDTNYESAFVTRLRRDAPEGVRFLGSVYDRMRLRALLGHCSVYVHGHSVGGTNPVLLDAMACGAHIAYLDVPFNREVVGDYGRPFPLDADALAGLLREAAAQPDSADPLRDGVRARAAERYTWDRATDAYEVLCRSLIETGRAPLLP